MTMVEWGWPGIHRSGRRVGSTCESLKLGANLVGLDCFQYARCFGGVVQISMGNGDHLGETAEHV
jgi:hypothetical protein